MKTVFAIMCAKRPGPVGEALAREYPSEDILVIASNQWLLATSTTAAEVTKKLGLWLEEGKTGEELPSVFVASISSYSGLMPVDVWEWIKTKWRSP